MTKACTYTNTCRVAATKCPQQPCCLILTETHPSQEHTKSYKSMHLHKHMQGGTNEASTAAMLQHLVGGAPEVVARLGGVQGLEGLDQAQLSAVLRQQLQVGVVCVGVVVGG